ncbi:MAG: hypothetical protein ABFS34_09405 [Gemmatimonadota bacterium]
MRSKPGRILREGLIGGVVAYAAVVLVFAVLNAVQGRSIFHTAAAMGAVFFYGADASSRFVVEAGPVLAYNGVHLLGSIAVATVAAFQVFETERHVSFWYFPFTVLVAAILYSITVFGVFGVEIGGVLDWSTVNIGTAVWVGSMTGYFVWVHRGLMRRIREDAETGA